MHGCGIYEKLVNLYKMNKSIVIFQNFIAKERGNVMIQKPHLTFHKKNRVDENDLNASLLTLYVSPFSFYPVLISLKTDNGFPNKEKKRSDS